MFKNKIENITKTFPNCHYLIDCKDMDDYKSKIEIIKSDITKKAKYNYIEFKNHKDIINKDVYSEKIIINNDNQFLNLKDYFSIHSLIINYISTKYHNDLKIEGIPYEVSVLLNTFLNDTYKYIIFKLENRNELNINAILESIIDFKNILKEAESFLGKELFDKEKIDNYEKLFKDYNLKEILNEIINEDFKISHNKLNYKNIFYSTSPLIFIEVNEFYKNVFLDAIIMSCITNILGMNIEEKSLDLNMTMPKNRKRIIVFMDKPPINDPFHPILYSQLRGLGLNLIYPNIDNGEKKEYFKASFRKLYVNDKYVETKDFNAERYYLK